MPVININLPENAELKKAVNNLKIDLLSKQSTVFYSTILFSMKWIITDDIKTADVDGFELRFNPQFLLEQDKLQRIGLAAHEALHVALNHIFRGKAYDPDKFNDAADHAINLHLLAHGFKLPDGGLADSKFKNLSAELIYPHIVADPSKGSGGGTGFNGNDIRYTNEGDHGMSTQAQQAKIDSIITKAVTASKMAGDKPGTIPGDVEIYVQELLNPKLPWTHLLEHYTDAFVNDDFSYNRANRRFLPEFYLPTLYSEGMGKLAVAVDTSCSVRDDQFIEFISEIEEIRIKLKPEVTNIMGFDTRISFSAQLDPEDPIEQVKFKGRGGTSLDPVFEYYNRPENSPQVLIVFSDLEVDLDIPEPNYPVIWICFENPDVEVPFGTLIHYDE